MTKPCTLTASRELPAGLIQVAAAHLTVEAAARTIRGAVTEYGVVGYTSAGPTIFLTGSLTPPSPVTKAKLLVGHDTSAAAVGIMTSFTNDDKLPTAAFAIPAGLEGDDALAKAQNGLRDGLSVGVHIDAYYWDADDNLVVTAGSIYEVSLVTIAAFENAGVTSVAAAHKEESKNMDTPETLAAALAAGTITQSQHDTRLAALTAAQPAPAAAATPAEPAAAAAAPALVTAAAPAAAAAPERQASPIITADRPNIDLLTAARITIQHIQAGRSLEQLTAALSDTVPGGDTGQAYLGRPTFLGELWSPQNDDRPLIDVFGTKPLEGDLITGYQWGVKPTVPQYAGSKAAVHSEALTWVPVSMEPVEFAAGWDIARKFIDLGRAGLIADTYEKAVEDYRQQTEAYVESTTLAAATAVTAYADTIALLTGLGALALTTGFHLDYVQLSSTIWGEFVNLKEEDVPWWLRNQGTINLGTSRGTAGGIDFSVGQNLGARVWQAGDKRAASYYEVDPPIQVQALNIPNGGVDLGVHGYAGLLINDARGLRKGTVTAPA